MEVLEVLKQKIVKRKAKIEVLGLGYIGLSTAALFANAGFDTMEVDISKYICRKTVENFSWDEIAKITINLYNGLL